MVHKALALLLDDSLLGFYLRPFSVTHTFNCYVRICHTWTLFINLLMPWLSLIHLSCQLTEVQVIIRDGLLFPNCITPKRYFWKTVDLLCSFQFLGLVCNYCILGCLHWQFPSLWASFTLLFLVCIYAYNLVIVQVFILFWVILLSNLISELRVEEWAANW